MIAASYQDEHVTKLRLSVQAVSLANLLGVVSATLWVSTSIKVHNVYARATAPHNMDSIQASPLER